MALATGKSSTLENPGTAKHDIVPAHLAVQAMRDNGYKNTAFAVAELIDNAIQAGATRVELLCGEREIQVQQRKRSRIHELAVLDNGSGMDAAVLRMALQFGNGTHLMAEEQEGIGKFGMGLPSSSISQCTRVDVWTWQNGPDSALYSYLDLNEIRNRQLHEVPEPRAKAIPKLWRTVGQSFGTSGTLVVWSHLDRVIWKSARSIIENSESLIGRIYRKFLNGDRVKIRLYTFNSDSPSALNEERYALPNDPMYLMARTSCPAPWDKTPMFEPYGEPSDLQVQYRGETHPVRVTFAVAKLEARSAPNSGNLPHGKHAARNIGVSIVRAGRELDLEQSWVIQYNPVERWWGVEVEFPPALDDLFGVSNNKQSARNFHEIDVNGLLLPGETEAQLRERLRDEEDPMGPLLDLSHQIDENLGVIRKLLDAQKKGERRKRHADHKAEEIATIQTQKRKEEGFHGESDESESLPAAQREQEIAIELSRVGVPDPVAQGIAATTVHNGLKFTIVDAAIESAAFFSVTLKAGAVIVALNTTHPAYHKLVEALEDDANTLDAEHLRRRLQNARDGLRLLLLAWARYEDELTGARRTQAQDTRVDWGRIARQFLEL